MANRIIRMYQVEVLQNSDSRTQSYEAFLQRKFSRLKDNRNPIDCHVVVKNGDEWIAGASLAQQEFLENDPDINDLWKVKNLANCSRILRLWSLRSTAIPCLLHAVEKQIPNDSFVYGILSVSHRFFLENQNLFQTKLQIAKPRHQVQGMQFADEDFSTSEGQRLIKVYKKFDAEFLGPLAVSPADQAIRALMGISIKTKSEPLFWKRYESAF